MTPLLEVRGVEVGFPVRGGVARAVDGVDLAIEISPSVPPA